MLGCLKCMGNLFSYSRFSQQVHPVVNISRVQLYKPQVERQKKILPKLVIIEGEKEFEIEKILYKRTVKGKEKFLVR